MGGAAKTESSSSQQTIDERIAAADQGVAVRGGGDYSETNVNYSIETSNDDLLLALASGAADLFSDLGDRSNNIADSAINALGSVKATELTGGGTDLNKTLMYAIMAGLGAWVLVTFVKK